MPLDQAVALVETYQLNRYRAEDVMIRAAASSDATLIPRLREIAETYTAVQARVSFTALHALWELGAPESYFVDNINHHRANPTLAFYSAWVAARAPNETTLATIEVAASGNGLKLDAARVAYGEVLELERQYAGETFEGEPITTEMRARGLINVLAVAYRFNWPLDSWTAPVDSTAELTYLHPEAVWARKKLIALASTDPRVVLDAVGSIADDPFFFDEYGSGLSDEVWKEVAQDFAEFVIREAFLNRQGGW